MNFESYPDRDVLAMAVADVLASELKNCLLNHEHASMAVPGGTTPGPIFDVLSAVRLEWDRVHVMLTDERWVPEGDPRSNTTLVRKRLLTGPAAAAKYVPICSEAAPEDALPGLIEGLEAELPVSVLVLGMGDDMHTASLFPGAAGLAEALAPDAPALVMLDPADQPERRVSLAAHVLDGAMSKHLVIMGAGKREALERATHLSPEEAPIRAVMSELTVHWAE